MSRFIAALALVSALGVAAPAAAQEVRSRVVTYGELDLNRDAGADTLIRRIENAADSVCGDRGERMLTERMAANACAQRSTENAIYDVGHPNVSGRYYGHTPQVIIEDDQYYRKGG